jgi:hypothetical protein
MVQRSEFRLKQRQAVRARLLGPDPFGTSRAGSDRCRQPSSRLAAGQAIAHNTWSFQDHSLDTPGLPLGGTEMARQTDGPTSRRPGRRSGRPPELPQGIVTFLCTDVEGSSPLWELHRAAMSTALARHEALISTVVTAHNGRLIKSKGEGDSTLSVFPASK